MRGDWGIGVERDWGIGVQGDWGIKVGGDWGIGEGGANFNDYLPSQRKEFLKIGRNKNEKMDIKTSYLYSVNPKNFFFTQKSLFSQIKPEKNLNFCYRI